jgi:1,2-diacylglycerol-3-alpha-glucose alpha-1,2-galactosyltransferase
MPSVAPKPDPSARPLTVNLVSETVFDVTQQGHGVHTAFLQTREALRKAGVDVRVNSKEPSDIVHIQTMGLHAFRILARNRANSVITAHIVPGSFVGSFTMANMWLPIGTAYLRFFYGMASEILAVSPAVEKELHEMHMRPPVRVVPNAIDVHASKPRPGEREALRERLGIPPDRFVVLCVGQVQPRKGIAVFLEAAHAMPDVTFVWVGGMPFRRLTADHAGMVRAVDGAPDNCIFAGEVPHEETRSWYAAADCFFFPSRQETFGLAIVEAAAASLPLVLRDLGTYRPLFRDAYLPADDTTFIETLERLRDDRALREHYAQAAWDIALEFDTTHLATRLLDVYADVLERAQGTDERRAGRTARRRIGPALQQAMSAWHKG